MTVSDVRNIIHSSEALVVARALFVSGNQIAEIFFFLFFFSFPKTDVLHNIKGKVCRFYTSESVDKCRGHLLPM